MRWCNYLLKQNFWSVKGNSDWESHGCNKIQNQFYLVWGLLDSCLFIGTNWPLIITYITLFFFSPLYFLQSSQKERSKHDDWGKSVNCFWTNTHESSRFWYIRCSYWHEIAKTCNREPHYESRYSIW